jgi:HK97 family phage major capsid protein
MTTSAKDYILAEASKQLDEATTIADGAKSAGRSLTSEEREKVETLIADATEKKARAKEIDDNEALLANIEQMRGPLNSPASEAPTSGVSSPGDAFIKSDAFQALHSGLKSGSLGGKWTSGPVELPGFGAKATVTSTASPIVQEDFVGFGPSAAAATLRRLTIADLMAQGTTDSSTVKYLQEATGTNAAAAVDEGGTKPESTITFTEVDEAVRKIATLLPVSDEMLEDVSQLRSYLDQRLRLFVEHTIEAQLLAGTGTAPEISGILDRVGLQTGTRSALGVTTGETAGSTTVGNALFQAITNIRNNAQVEPDAVVMHPTNWAQLRLAKDSQLQYLGGGPMIGAYGQGLMTGETVWGLPVVVTSAITLNTALVGAFRSMSQVFYRNSLTVEASNSHASFFATNHTMIRAEQRLALAVYRPSAFHAVTALQTP